MSRLIGEFNSPLRDEPLPLVTDMTGHFGYHDIHSGTMIIAVNLGDTEGAKIFKFDELDIDQTEAFRKIQGLLTPDNVTQRLVPFGVSREMPVRLDDGEPGKLVISHLPRIALNHLRVGH